jgi:hypothetical protein
MPQLILAVIQLLRARYVDERQGFRNGLLKSDIYSGKSD